MIYFLAPLPPPVHGFSLINQRMLIALKELGDVVALDSAPKLTKGGTAGGRISRLLYLPTILLAFYWGVLRNRPKSLYIGLSGGIGQLLDLVFYVMARLSKVEVYIHHHSFSYLNRRSWFNRLVFGFIRSSQHVVLCEGMGQRLADLYSISPAHVYVLSNAAFLPEFKSSDLKVDSDRICLGFLSNIISEKGIFEFFEVFQAADADGLPVEGVIAGPLAPEVEEAFFRRLAEFNNLLYLGPVYGEAKEAFFQRVDVLLFPSRLNEAEPVTILEALQASVPVIAIGKGCIPSMLPHSAGLVVSPDVSFGDVAIKEIRRMAEDGTYLSSRKKGASNYFLKTREVHVNKLNRLLEAITSGTRFGDIV